MNVYLAAKEYPYEGDMHLGVFTTLAKAKGACQAHFERLSEQTRKLDWMRNNPHWTWVSDKHDYDFYSVQRMTVDKEGS